MILYHYLWTLPYFIMRLRHDSTRDILLATVHDMFCSICMDILYFIWKTNIGWIIRTRKNTFFPFFNLNFLWCFKTTSNQNVKVNPASSTKCITHKSPEVVRHRVDWSSNNRTEITWAVSLLFYWRQRNLGKVPS